MKRHLPILLLCLVAIICTYACAEQKNTVRFKGQIEGAQRISTLHYYGPLSQFTKDRDFTIHTDENGYFDTILPINKAAYFLFISNRPFVELYISPGDEVEVYRTRDDKATEFKGTHAAQNKYINEMVSFSLVDRQFPAKENRLAEFMEVKPILDELATKATRQLEDIKEATAEFKIMESARIRSNLIQAYLSSYLHTEGVKDLSRQEQAQWKNEHNDAVISTYVLPLMPDILHEDFLELKEIQYLFSDIQIKFKSYFQNITLPQQAVELVTSFEYVRSLKQHATSELIKEAKEYTQKMTDVDYRKHLLNSIGKAEMYIPGKPAFDVEMENAEGQIMHLSDFTGKVIYIDFWATWCGPCIMESPFFEALAQKYEGKDIVFIPISIDENKKNWQTYVAGKNSPLPHMLLTPQEVDRNTTRREAWDIGAVPRFAIIDKDFKFIDYFAPRPSDKGIEAILNNALAQQ